jgi:molybdopterin/thiamine biosynthesis adenylyltransferase
MQSAGMGFSACRAAEKLALLTIRTLLSVNHVVITVAPLRKPIFFKLYDDGSLYTKDGC